MGKCCGFLTVGGTEVDGVEGELAWRGSIGGKPYQGKDVLGVMW